MLQAKNISLSFGERQVLKDVSLSVAPGELVALIGPNGAGKSTLLSVLSGEVTPRSGSVLLDGEPVQSFSARELARRRAVLLQKTEVAFSYPVQDVVRMGRAPWRGTEESEQDDALVAQSMELTQVAHMATRDVTTLSGGESGRVHLARIFAQATPLIFLDEPTAALDILHQEQTLVHTREKVAQGAAAVVVLHDLDAAAAYADRIVLLANGQVLADGAPHEVCTAELLSQVYDHPIEVLEHPSNGRLLIVPKR